MKVTSSRANTVTNNGTSFMKKIGLRFLPARFSTRLVLSLTVVFLVASVIFVTSSAQDGDRAVQSNVVVTEADMFDRNSAEPKVDSLPETDEAEPGGSNNLIAATTYPFTSAAGIALEDMSSGTTTLIVAGSDDGNSVLSNIGFEYWYDGIRFTQFGANANGFARLGAAPTGLSFDNVAGFASTTNAPKIVPFYDDLCVGTTGKVHFKTIGSAPNRKLIVEWQGMQITRGGGGCAGVGGGTFQMWLFESAHASTPGVIEFVYGPGMVDTQVFDGGYSAGLQSGAATNFASVTTTGPTVDYATANNTQMNAITSGTAYLFTPNVPLAPSGMGVSPITPVSLQLNWGDNATTEVGYVIYRSTDNVNFSFLTQIAAGSTSFTDTGLNPSTQYFYLINAVTEGALSSNLALSATTTAGGNITSAASGNWDVPATWVGGAVPTAGDNVTIANGHTVTINSSNALSVTVQNGGVLEYEGAVARTLTVGQFVTIDSGGTFRSNLTGLALLHSLVVGTNLTNNGVLDFSTAAAAGVGITFVGAANNTFSGTGATTDVHTITINKGVSSVNSLELTTTAFTVQGVNTDVAGFLTLTNGTFKLSGSFTMANRVFTGAAAYSIPATGGFWLNNPNFTVVGQNGSPTNNGLLRLSQGIYNVGTGSGNSLGAGTGGQFIIDGGTLNTAGRLQSTSASISYTQSGGDVNVCTVGQTAATACFGLTATTNIFNMTGGNITLVTPSGAATPLDYSVSTTAVFTANPAVTNLNVGTGAAAQTFRVTGATPNIVIPANKSLAAGSGTGASVFLRGSTVTNNGAILTQGTGSRFDFAAAGPMSYSGAGTFGTLAAPFGGVGVSSNSLSLVTLNSPIITNRVNLFVGGFINSGQITLGNAGASTTVVQIGSTGLTTAGGSFDVSPVHNQGTGGQIMLYAFESTPRTTGVEVNPTRILTSINLIDNINTVTIAGGDLTLTATGVAIVLTNGRFITGANNLILNSGTATVTRTNGYVDGNFTKTFAAAANKTFEVGTANGYSPVAVNVTAGTFPATFTAKAVQGPQPNFGTPSLALQRYWSLTEGGDVTADLTFNYLDPIDIPVTATEANFVIFKHDGAFTMPGGTVTPAANTANITGVTSFSDWTLAETGATAVPGALQFSSPTYTIGEEGVQASISVTRTGGADGMVTVDYATVAGGNATGGAACAPGIDYVNTTGTLVFPDQNTSQSFNIPLCGDLIDEVDETVNLQLSNPTGGATLGTQTTAVLTLTDDDVGFVGPVTVTATAGTPGPTDYATLKLAFDAINAGTHQGAINVAIVTSTVETASAVLNNSGAGGAVYTSVLIRPTAVVSVSGSIVGAVIKLNGADNVTLDGRIGGTGTSRDLTVSNTSTATATAAVWLASVAAGNGASNNVVRNVELACGATQNTGAISTFGIYMGGTTIVVGATDGNDNDNNSFIANRIIRVRYGIVTRGLATNLNINPVVTDNIIGPAAFGPDQIGKVGIFMQSDVGANVSRNTVQFVGGDFANTSGGADRVGIAIGVENWASTPGTLASSDYNVTRNVIHDVIEERTFSAIGILLSTTNGANPTNNLVANNFVYNLKANGTLGDTGVGIGIGGGNGDRVVFNSVRMAGDLDPNASATTPTQTSVNLRIANTPTNLTVKNNSLYNDVFSSSAPALLSANIQVQSATFNFGTGGLNNNNYFFPGGNTTARTGAIGTTSLATTFFATLANWQAAITPAQDANSIQGDPQYLSATDLHIALASPNVNAGATGTGVTNDIDAQLRDAMPDIGADEPNGVTPPANDIAATAIITPANGGVLPTGATPSPQASFTNVGSATQTNVMVQFTITGPGGYNYSNTQSIASIDPEQTVVVTFAAVPAFTTIGAYVSGAAVTTADANAANDAVAGGFTVVSPLSGTYTVGSGGNFASLTNPGGIFEAINAAGATGNITIDITSDLTGENGGVALNEIAGGFTVLIKPSGGPRSITGSSTVGIIRLNSADGVTVNGSTTGAVVESDVVGGNPALRELTVNNTNPAATAGAVIVVMAGANGAQNNTFKNINIAGFSPTATLIGIALGGATPGAAGLDNDNNRVENCSFQRAFIGIYNVGASAANPNTGTVITQNDLSATGANRLRRAGILVFNENGIQITENSIGGITSDEGLDAYGIGVGIQDVTATAVTNGGISNALISRNKINGVVSTSLTGFSASGIAIAGNTTAPNTISNNMISGVSAPATNPDIVDGIFVAGVVGSNTRVYHNSISLTGDRGAVASQIGSYGVAISGTNPTVELKNNIFYTTQTSGGGANAKSYAIGMASATFTNLNSNFNDFFFSGANAAGFRTGSLGATGTDLATLGAWQTATSQDAGSFSVDPSYVDPLSDLHLQAGSPMINVGTTGTGVTIDIDGETRDATPDIGADEIVSGVGGTLQFSSPTYTIGEAGVQASITVTRTGGTGSVSVDYATVAGGSATGGGACGGTVDYVTTSGTLVFPDANSQSFNIPICSDALDEIDETVNLALSNATGGATLGTPNTAVLTITDDDATPSIAIVSPSPTNEGNAGPTVFTFNVNLSAASGQTVSVHYQTNDGSATTANNDYVGIPDTVLTFNPGQTSLPINVTVNGDFTPEPDETFTVDLSTPVNATISSGQGTGTIVNDDGAASTFSIDDVRTQETNTGTHLVTFTVSLFSPGSPPGFASVNYATGGGTATPGAASPADYMSASGTLNFGALDEGSTPDGGSTQTQTFTVTIFGDVDKEPNETFFVTLSNPINGVIGDGTGSCVINDEDRAYVADFDRDLKTDLSVFRPVGDFTDGIWYIRQSTNLVTKYVTFGVNGDKIVPGDYDADGVTDLAIFRPSTGTWFIERSSDFGVIQVQWGLSSDLPVQGDYDGDDKTDVAVFRPSDGTWYVIKSSDSSVRTFQWGAAGDKVAPGDYDGDGLSDFAVFRPSGGTWFVKPNTDTPIMTISFGTNGDVPLSGDFDGDGSTDIAVFRPSDGNWYILTSLTGATISEHWGQANDIPVVGDYDGDGKSDIAVWRPSDGNWYVLNSNDPAPRIPNAAIPSFAHWGQAGDKPVPAAYVPEQ